MRGKQKAAYKRDLALAGILLVAAVALLLLMRGRQTEETVSGPVAVVTVNGKEAGRYPLTDDGTFPLNGGSNVLVISDGEAWVSEANCPDRICMGMGKISKSGEFIACLPNRLIITVEETGAQSPDAVT